MKFGRKIRQLRHAMGRTQRDLGAVVGVEFSYISKIENAKLDFGDSPGDGLIHRLADALDGDEFELMVLAGKDRRFDGAEFCHPNSTGLGERPF